MKVHDPTAYPNISKQIAQRLYYSHSWVKQTISDALRKSGCRTRLELALWVERRKVGVK